MKSKSTLTFFMLIGFLTSVKHKWRPNIDMETNSDHDKPCNVAHFQACPKMCPFWVSGLACIPQNNNALV